MKALVLPARRFHMRAIVAAALSAAAWAAVPDPVAPSSVPRGGTADTPAASAAEGAPLRDLARAAGSLSRGKIRNARVTILKQSRTLTVASGDKTLKVYRVELGPAPEEPKEREGDGRTPEGEYYICEHRSATHYHRALLLSYPNARDAERGLARGAISPREAKAIRSAIAKGRCPPQNTALGGLILIHGQHPKETEYWQELGVSAGGDAAAGLESGDRDPSVPYEPGDWTQGCIGMSNQDIRELYDLLPRGTPVTIRCDG